MKFVSKKSLNILVVEDDPVSMALLESLLSKALTNINELISAETLETAIDHLNEHSCDIVLLDLNLPDSTGLNTLKSITEISNGAAIVVITGDYDDDVGLEAVTHGAQEYLVKGRYDAYILGRSIKYAIERKRSEDLLQKKENQYRTLVENLPQRILLKDMNSVFVSCNENYARNLGMISEEIIGKTDYDIYLKESADKYRASDIEVMKSRTRKDDYITLTEKGKEKIVHLTKTPVINEEDELIGVLCIFENVTKQKHAEKEAKRAYEDLQGAHEELKNVQSQIVQNEKLASIGQLAAGVAHEINNPMGFVSSNFETLQSYVKKFQGLFDVYSELVKEAKCQGGKKLIEKVEKIEELCEDTQIDFIIEDIGSLFSDMQEGLGRITNIVQSLRDFSRVDQAEDFAEYNINDGIESTLMVANNEIKYDADVETDFAEVPLVLCNSSQINQVFLNIFINAAQAIKSQERNKRGVINVKTFVEGEDVVCEIADDGPGIPPEKMSKIFDPFFTTKAPGKGTGLGLSVSYDIIVNKHKGTLLVDSTVDEGTTFTIRLSIKCKDLKEIEKNKEAFGLIC